METGTKKVQIAGKAIGGDEPAFIVAEVALSHQGSPEAAKKLIGAAKSAGADAIKFQVFQAEELAVPSHPYFDVYKKSEFTKDEWKEIIELAREKGIPLIADVFDTESADLMDKHCSAFKIHSGEITNYRLIEHVAKKKKPVLLGAGEATLGEIESALDILGKHTEDIVLLHGYQNYPTDIPELNLRTIRTLQTAFRFPVGLADHTDGGTGMALTIPMVAVAAGASLIEKHITLDRSAKGIDYQSSLEEEGFKRMVGDIRAVESALGSRVKSILPNERERRIEQGRNIVAASDIPAGTKIAREHLTFKRAGCGFPPSEEFRVLGKKTKNPIRKDQPITEKFLE